MAENEPNKAPKENVADLSAMLGMGGFLDGVSNLINKFGDLAERGESLRKTMGETKTAAKPMRTSGGFTVRFGGLKGDESESTSVRPMNTRPTATPNSQRKTDAASVVPKERTANVELFEEEDHWLLLAEMPGVASQDVSLNFEDKTLFLQGTSPTAQFKAQIELPKTFTSEQVTIHANNGVVEIRLAL